jgi:hypothetical protein
MFERYTENARRAVFFARYEASRYGSPYIETEHLLLGLLRDQSVARTFLGQGDVEAEFRSEIERHITRRERISTSVEVPLTVDCKKVLDLAAEEADRLGQRQVGTEHIFLGMLGVEGSLAGRLLQVKGLKAAQVREQLAKTSRSISDSTEERRDDKAKLTLDGFLAGLKSETAEELIEFFARDAEFIDAFGKRWSRDEIFKQFELLFAPYAKKNAAPVVEGTLADTSDLYVATVLWKNAILASLQRIWIHRMTIVLIREDVEWRILLMHVTPVAASLGQGDAALPVCVGRPDIRPRAENRLSGNAV